MTDGILPAETQGDDGGSRQASAVGGRLAFRLGSGDEVERAVVLVGKSLVHAAKITGKDYFVVVISVDKISAVRVRVRDKWRGLNRPPYFRCCAVTSNRNAHEPLGR